MISDETIIIAFSATSDNESACLAIIDEISTKLPRAIETGFGPQARHITFENALTKISERLGKDTFCFFCCNSYYLISVFRK